MNHKFISCHREAMTKFTNSSELGSLWKIALLANTGANASVEAIALGKKSK